MKKARQYINYVRQISTRFAIISLCGVIDERLRRVFGKSYSKSIYKKKDEIFQNFLIESFSEFISSWKAREEEGVPFEDAECAPIWTFWLQGEEGMPQFVKDMREVLLENCGKHPVNLLSLKNVTSYLPRISKYVTMYQNGKICAAHLSDIVRINLLKEYGGVWLDASILLSGELKTDYFSVPFWTAKDLDPFFPFEPKCIDITKFETYFMCSWKNALLFAFAAEFLDAYFEKYDTVLDYLLINHIFKIARKYLPVIATEYAAIPSNNQECELLSGILDQCVCNPSLGQWGALLNGDTQVFKLSTRAPHAETLESAAGRSVAYVCYRQWKNNKVDQD